MIKTIKAAIIVLCLLISASAFSQSKQPIDSVALWNKYRDSALSHTSIAQFQEWLYENATVKQYNESKFVDFYNAYVQYQMQLFLQPKNKKK